MLWHLNQQLVPDEAMVAHRCSNSATLGRYCQIGFLPGDSETRGQGSFGRGFGPGGFASKRVRQLGDPLQISVTAKEAQLQPLTSKHEAGLQLSLSVCDVFDVRLGLVCLERMELSNAPFWCLFTASQTERDPKFGERGPFRVKAQQVVVVANVGQGSVESFRAWASIQAQAWDKLWDLICIALASLTLCVCLCDFCASILNSCKQSFDVFRMFYKLPSNRLYRGADVRP